jgi:glycosyltransferase involved in cell wall biosynthesis
LSAKNLLVVSYHFPPNATAGVFRVLGLIRHLQKRGWNVTVLTVRRAAHEHSDDSTLEMVPHGVTVIRTPSPELAGWVRSLALRRKKARAAAEAPSAGARSRPAGQSGSFRSRVYRVASAPLRWVYHVLSFPDLQAGWIPVVAYHTWRWVSDHPGTVVLSSTPPHSTQLGVGLARALKRFRWVVDLRDPWTSPLRKPKGRFSLSVQRGMERWVLNRADHIVANTPGNRDALLKAFPHVPAAKVSAVTNAFDNEDPVDPVDAGDPMLDCDIAYFGELYPDMLSVYLDAIVELGRRGAAIPRLYVFGIVDDDDVTRVRDAGMEQHVVFQGTVPYARSISLMRGARSLLLLLPDLPRWATCVPSKLYAYLFSGRPILAIAPPGDAMRIVSETGSGVTLPPSDPATVADAIESFVASLGSGEEPAAGRRDEQKLAAYSMGSIAGRIDEILGRSD